MDPSTDRAKQLAENFKRPGFDLAMRLELSNVLANPLFKNSRTLTRLLRFLVDETLAGRGDALKGYTIAVEGLGRPDDFDAKSDSYPRVQVGRLRKSLESYYSQNEPMADLCLYLQPGSYRVRLARVSSAYPKLYRPSSSDTQSLDDPQTVDISQTSSMDGLSLWQRVLRRPALLILAITLLGVAVISFLLFFQSTPGGSGADRPSAAASHHESPTVFVTPVAAKADSGSADLSRSAYAVLVDGLSRSWVSRVRVGSAGSGAAPDPATANAYRLESQLEDRGNGSYILFARLTDANTSTLIWSTSTTVSPQNGSFVGEDLASLIGQISGPYGAVAAQESRQLRGSFEPGYPCMLQYLSFMGSRDPALYPKIVKCLALPANEGRVEAARLGLSSLFALDAGSVGNDRNAAIRSALDLARQAIDANPKDPYAQFAMARSSFLANDCVTGRRHAAMATAANPYDSMIQAVLGGLASQCGYPEGTTMLDHAYLLHVPGETYARLPLILAQITQKRYDRLPKLSAARPPRFGPSIAYYYLCETLISAALDQPTAAAANWKKFVEASPEPKTVEAMLSKIIVSDMTRARTIAFLMSKNVITPEMALSIG